MRSLASDKRITTLYNRKDLQVILMNKNHKVNVYNKRKYQITRKCERCNKRPSGSILNFLLSFHLQIYLLKEEGGGEGEG